jgi:hypothetical protein
VRHGLHGLAEAVTSSPLPSCASLRMSLDHVRRGRRGGGGGRAATITSLMRLLDGGWEGVISAAATGSVDVVAMSGLQCQEQPAPTPALPFGVFGVASRVTTDVG